MYKKFIAVIVLSTGLSYAANAIDTKTGNNEAKVLLAFFPGGAAGCAMNCNDLHPNDAAKRSACIKKSCK